MGAFFVRLVSTIGGCLSLVTLAQAQVRISEIMYHSVTENPAEEFVELQNLGPTNVNLSGWCFTKGVAFTFPQSHILPPGAILVVAANTNAFAVRYGNIPNVIGNWTGGLDNSDETIRLEDATGTMADEIFYADQGDYAVRVRGELDYNHRGWDWLATHDGEGKSLERLNLSLTGKCGENWAASIPTNGTPGTVNSTATNNIAPLIRDVAHYPVVPHSTDPVTITALLTDEQNIGLGAVLHWRNASITNPAAFIAVTMFDDGAHGDGLANDKLFGAILPVQTNGAVIEFYVAVNDAQNLSRTWPAAALETNGVPLQVCNALYQVDDTETDATRPSYRIILTRAEYDELYGIPNSGDPNNRSHAAFNGTWVTVDGAGTEVRYNCAFRNRGEGSRSVQPPNYRVSIPSDRRWRDVTALHLNSQYTHDQVAGAAIATQAGLATEYHRRVQLRINGIERANAGSPQFGSYVQQEAINSDFATQHWPEDDGGNLYRATASVPLNAHMANLNYLGTNYLTYITNGYSKNSNVSENDWTDLFQLTDALSNTPDSNYWSVVQQMIDVDVWVRYFAVFSLIGSEETSLGTGDADDFTLYRGIIDPRFRLVAHDWDTILNQAATGNPTASIFRATAVANISRFLKHSEVAPRYYAELLRQLDATFTPAEMSRILDATLGNWVPANYVDTMKTFATNRNAGVRAQIPAQLTIENSSPAGVLTGGLWRYTTANVTFSGSAHAAKTRSVVINGAPANWTAWTARWTNVVTLRPGLNNLLAQAFDVDGREIERTQRSVWYDSGVSQGAGGSVPSNATWSVAGGPYLVTNSITVAAGATLTIEPGTTVFLAAGVNFTVANGGRLLAEGTATNRIFFVTTPGAGVSWGGFTISGAVGSPETRIAHAHFEGNGTKCLQVSAGTVWLDHLTFGTTGQQYLSLDGASFLVQDCHFPTASAAFEMVHGTGGIKSGGRGVFVRNFFGAANGYNDVVDYTGGNRTGPVIHFFDNVFIGTGDDILDLDGTDSWIEGNIFLHAHKNGAVDSASAISGGNDGSNTSEVTIRGNIFFDCDQAAMAKQANFYTLLNNTIVRQTHQGGVDIAGGVVCLSDDGVAEGAGMYLEGNIIADAEALVRDRTNAIVTFTNNLIHQLVGPAWSGPGGNNRTNDAMFVHVPQMSETTNFNSWAAAQVVWDWFKLREGSPARGVGPNRIDLGGQIHRGVTISGEPPVSTALTNITLNFGSLAVGNGIPVAGFPAGSGFSHYKWRLNGGVWSSETAVTTPLALNNLTNGSYAVETVGKLDTGYYQDAAELGIAALVTTSRTWTVNTALPRGLQLNEVLARNLNTLRTNGESPDLVELYNSSATTIDLSGKGLTDDPAQKYRFTFAPGTTIGPGQFLTLYSDSSGAPALNLGFSFKSEGDDLYLYDSPANGGGLIDSVTFGLQLVDCSVGRRENGSWGLCQPTFGAVNTALSVANGESLRINEWLAAGAASTPDDFIELFNPDSVPAALGGLYLSDAPNGSPARHEVTALSFIAPHGYAVFKADGSTGAGADHLNFKLTPEFGSIGLFTHDLQLIDLIVYGAQRSGVSEGRSPDGAAEIASFNTPTPGAGNPGSLPGYVTTFNVGLMSFTNVWRFNQSNNLDAVNWTAVNYNDAAWQSGPGLLGYETSPTIGPLVRTTLLAPTAPPPGLSSGHAYYFRTKLVITNDLTGFTLTAKMRLDDCGVIYINGVEFSRPRMAAGTITNLSFGGGALGAGVEADADEAFIIPLALLPIGTNTIAVEVHQINAASSDVLWGMSLEANRSVTNFSTVKLNEVLADNASVTNADGSVTDWVEIYNPSAVPANLAGFSLSDSPSLPGRWVFPSGVTIPPAGFLVVRCDPNNAASLTNGAVLNTGFGLDSSGDAMCLFTPGNALLDSVIFGPQATDYAVGHVPENATDWELTLPTPGAENIVATLGPVANVRINEWAANVTSGPDWFELFNPNPQPVALTGLYLTDALANRIKHPIAALSFMGVNTNGWTKFIADGNTAQGPHHVGFSLAAGGEALGLYPAGTAPVIDAVAFTNQPADVSEGRFPDGATNRVFFVTPSPGAANWLPLTNIVINEVLSHTDLPLEDAVELRNLTAAPVDVSGWFISDSTSDLKKFRIPNGTIIPANGLKVFYEYEFNPEPGFARSFSFSSAIGDDSWLTGADALGNATGYRDHAKFGPQFNGISFGRFATSIGTDFTALSGLTFGTSVTAQSPANQISTFRTGLGAVNTYPRVGPVVITEIMYHPVPVGTNENPNEEFIELHNLSGVPVPLYDVAHPTNGWRLRDAVSFQFTTNHSIPAGGYLLVTGFDPATNSGSALVAFRNKYGTNGTVVGPWSGRLDNAGESVELAAPDSPQTTGPDIGLVPSVLVDKVVYSDLAPWPTTADGFGSSLQRLSFVSYGNDPANWIAALPTAGASGLADTDGDGMPDDWEDANGLNRLVNDAGLDADNDGFTNLQEYTAGTNPQSAASRLRIESVTANGGNVELRFTAMAGRTYSILYRDSLNPGVWLKLIDVASQAANHEVVVSDSAVAGQMQRFYRIVTPAQP